jgi:tetratricopeptide (TPR) repeat protein
VSEQESQVDVQFRCNSGKEPECRDYERALADFKQAVALDPYYSAPIAGRAAAYRGKGYYLLAIAYYSQALRRDPNFLPALAGRADVFAEGGEVDSAKADFQALVTRDIDANLRAIAQAYLADPAAFRKAELGQLPAGCGTYSQRQNGGAD